MSTIALDVDLHRVHGFSTTLGRVCYNAPEWPFDLILPKHKTVLIEIASPVCTSSDGAEDYNRRKWAIGNALMIGRFFFYLEREHPDRMNDVLVSPANLWTLGHKEPIREAIAGCAGQDNHDIRACRCMLFYHNTNPAKWQPLAAYYASLSTKKKKA